MDLSNITGSGPGGRIVKADVDGASGRSRRGAGRALPLPRLPPQPAAPVPVAAEIPYETVKLSNMRKTIARRLSESKQQIPHIYLTVDANLDRLLKLRAELNAGLEARGVKLSVNDMLIKALAAALIEVPECNVQFAGDHLIKFQRADISVAVSIPGGLITPIVVGADTRPCRRSRPRCTILQRAPARASSSRTNIRAARRRCPTWACTASRRSTR